MARVRKALSSGPLTGEPSARLEGSMTVKLLSPTDIWTPAKSRIGVDEGQGLQDPLELALAVAPDRGDAGIDDGPFVA